MTWKHETFTFTFIHSFFRLAGTPLTWCPQGVDTSNLWPLLPGWLLLMLFFNLQWKCRAATARLVADDVVLQSWATPPLPPPPRHRPSSWGCHLTGQMGPQQKLAQKQSWRSLALPFLPLHPPRAPPLWDLFASSIGLLLPTYCISSSLRQYLPSPSSCLSRMARNNKISWPSSFASPTIHCMFQIVSWCTWRSPCCCGGWQRGPTRPTCLCPAGHGCPPPQ